MTTYGVGIAMPYTERMAKQEAARLEGLAKPIPAGAILLLTEGEYSSYGIRTAVQATVAFSLAEAMAVWQPTAPEDEDEDDRQASFLAFLEAQGYVRPFRYHELFLGHSSYAGLTELTLTEVG